MLKIVNPETRENFQLSEPSFLFNQLPLRPVSRVYPVRGFETRVCWLVSWIDVTDRLKHSIQCLDSLVQFGLAVLDSRITCMLKPLNFLNWLKWLSISVEGSSVDFTHAHAYVVPRSQLVVWQVDDSKTIAMKTILFVIKYLSTVMQRYTHLARSHYPLHTAIKSKYSNQPLGITPAMYTDSTSTYQPCRPLGNISFSIFVSNCLGIQGLDR